MSYGTGVDPSSVDTNSCAESYWSNPPADINSEEYRNWYNQYCSYFYPQQFMSQRPRKDAVDSDGVEYDSDEALYAAGTSETRDDKDTKREDDGKQKKKKKNTDLLTKHKPVEPPGKSRTVGRLNPQVRPQKCRLVEPLGKSSDL